MKTVLLCGKAGCGKDTVASIMARDFGAGVLAQADPIKRMIRTLGATKDQLWGPSELRNTKIQGLDVPAIQEAIVYEFQVANLRHVPWNSVKQLPAIAHFHAQEPDLKPHKKKLLQWMREYITPEATVRTLLQTLGTECGRNSIDPNIWVRIAAQTANSMLFNGQDYSPHKGLLDRKKNFSFVVISDGRFLNEIKYVKMNGGVVVRIVDPEAQYSKPGHVSESELDTIPEEMYDAVLFNNKTEGLECLRSKVHLLVRRLVLPPPLYFI